MFRIGYVDEDAGQRNSFRQYLKEDFEIVLFDITEETELETLVDDIFSSGIDMLVLDFLLDETGLVDFNADQIIDRIQERNLYYPLIVLTSHEPDALDHLENVNLINGKEEMLGQKLEIFKQKLRKLASAYKSKISEKMNQLKILEEKRQGEGLQPGEEDNYVELNNFIDKTNAANSRLARSFYSNDTNNRLDILIQKAEEILKKASDSE